MVNKSKICCGCGETKSTDCFGKYGRSPDGLRPRCKKCVNAALLVWRLSNPEKYKATTIRNSVAKKERDVAYRERLKKEQPDRLAGWYRTYKTKRPEIGRIASRKYYENNKTVLLQRVKDARKRDPVRYHLYAKNYIHRRRKACPSWLTKEQLSQIEIFYRLARDMTVETGILHDVDHIVPLKGKTVCGLHVPWNLQILTKSENCQKHNRFTDGGEARFVTTDK